MSPESCASPKPGSEGLAMPTHPPAPPDRIKVLRSKNAGPYALTFDVVFRDPADFRAFAARVRPDDVARAYGRPVTDVISTETIEALNAFKVSLVRDQPAGHPGDSDCYGMNQEEPLARLVRAVLDYE
ncbi:MAG: DUF4387 domain-containing protein [Rhodospirillales bacterium]|nr:DUF4387 domain-containing protein [Acidimicrobiia bacterium]MBM3952793.1 DUF4387 domain-containing protein [Rhodospirillales bacterium]